MSYLARFSLSLFAWLAVCALAVLCTAGIARAQPVSLSACTPIAGPKIAYQPLGRHLAFACTDASRTVIYQDGVSCLHATCNVDATAAAALRIMQATDRKAAIDAEWAVIRWDCNNPPGDAERALCTERMAWIATWWADAIKDFRPAVWRVKANGTASTRPAYTLTNGTLGTVIAGRALVGAVCDLTRPTAPATGNDIRAEYGRPGLVTICAKVVQ